MSQRACRQALRTLDGFPGRLVIRAGGFRLETVRTWHGVSLDPDTRELSYQGHTQTLTDDQTRVVAALIDGGPGSLASRTGLGTVASNVASRLPEVLAGLSGFPGEVTQRGVNHAWVLVPSGPVAGGQDAGSGPGSDSGDRGGAGREPVVAPAGPRQQRRGRQRRGGLGHGSPAARAEPRRRSRASTSGKRWWPSHPAGSGSGTVFPWTCTQTAGNCAIKATPGA